MPLAVADLVQAQADFERLGFVLKPGRPHDDGIHNAHVKFANGTEIELITAARPTDALAREYSDFLRAGDGPAFWSLYDPDLVALTKRLRAMGVHGADTGEIVTFPQADMAHRLFFADRLRSPTDQPEHFLHRNGASRLQAIWIVAAADERRLLLALGARTAPNRACAPFERSGETMVLPEGDEIMLVGRGRRSPERAILAATVAVRSLVDATRTLDQAGVPHRASDCARGSVWIAPAQAHGLWLELRESPAKTGAGGLTASEAP